MTTTLSLGFSSCPNDTFIFDAMIHGRIDTEELSFEPVIADVEELNKRAFARELQITKVSYHAFAYLTGSYSLLDSGSALGRGCGPLLIAREPISLERLQESAIAIPGKYTTANFLLSLALPRAEKKREMLFSHIEPALLKGEVEGGVIIHENRFTYEERGLVKIMDLGAYWEETAESPIPLGGIIIKKELPSSLQQKVARVLKRSAAYAFKNPEKSRSFVREQAQEMEDRVVDEHIALYVNDYSLSLGDEGRQAVEKMFLLGSQKGIFPKVEEEIFLSSD